MLSSILLDLQSNLFPKQGRAIVPAEHTETNIKLFFFQRVYLYDRVRLPWFSYNGNQMWCLRSELGVLHWEVENYLFFSRFLSNFQYELVHKVLLDRKLLHTSYTIQQQTESLLAWLMLLCPDPEAGRICGEACGCGQTGQLTTQQKQGVRPWSLALQCVVVSGGGERPDPDMARW